MKLTEKKRKDILEAAIREFREQGFAAARINRIADLAGVSKRTLYKHFESKEALFSAIVEILMQQTAAMPKMAYRQDLPLKEQLVSAMRDYVARITDEEYMGLNRLVISEFLRDQELSRAFFAQAERLDYPVTGLIAEAMADGKLRQADAAYAAGQLLALIKNFFFWPEFLTGTPRDQDADKVMSDCVDMFLAHYAPHAGG